MRQETDMAGNKINLGDTVVRAISLGRSPALTIATVTKVDELGRIYLDNSPQHIRTASRSIKVL